MMQSVGLIVAMVLSSMLAAESEPSGSAVPSRRPEMAPQPRESLKLEEIPFKIVYETYRPTDGKPNWELYTLKADGTEMTNLTNTPDVDEMYPHVSPDGTKISFVVDEGSGRRRVRHVYYMNADGTGRVHVAAHARQPCWCFDSKSIAYCNDEYERYSTREYATSGVTLYHLEGSWSRPHRNAELHHLYALCWAPYGKWFLGVVHGGMGYSDTILAFEAFGTGVFDLARFDVKGCRPDLNTDGTRMVWGETDWNLRTADIDLTGAEPVVTNIREIVRCAREYKVYHVDFSPDGRHVVFSYGPVVGGQQVGGWARDWNLCVGDFDGRWVQITTDGLHNKEPDWMPIPQAKP